MNDGPGVSTLALARDVYALFNARDVNGMHDLMAADVEWDWSRSLGPDVGVRHGRAAVLRFLAMHWEHWDAIEMVPVSIADVEGSVVVDVEVTLRGRDGIELTVRGGHVQVWSEGLLTRYVLFQTLEDAIEAARADGHSGLR